VKHVTAGDAVVFARDLRRSDPFDAFDTREYTLRS